MQREVTPFPSPGRLSSMSPTASSSVSSSMTNPLTFAMASSKITSGNLTSAPEYSAATSAGPPLLDAQSRYHPCAWCRSPSGPSRLSATRSSRLMPRCVLWCSQSWSPTKRSRPRVMTPGWAPLSRPHSRARSIRLRVPPGLWSITPGSAVCASGQRWITSSRDHLRWWSNLKAHPMSSACPSQDD